MNAVPQATERDWRTPLELTLLGAIWGCSFLFMRVAVPSFGPFALVEVRLVLGALVLLPFLWRARAPQERQQHQGAQHQPHLDQRERAERRHRHPHEQERAAPDGAQQGQFQRRAPVALGRLWDRIHALPPSIACSSPRQTGSGADACRTSA